MLIAWHNWIAATNQDAYPNVERREADIRTEHPNVNDAISTSSMSAHVRSCGLKLCIVYISSRACHGQEEHGSEIVETRERIGFGVPNLSPVAPVLGVVVSSVYLPRISGPKRPRSLSPPPLLVELNRRNRTARSRLFPSPSRIVWTSPRSSVAPHNTPSRHHSRRTQRST